MLIAGLLMLIIAILPFLLGLMIFRTLGNNKLSLLIMGFMTSVGFWQINVSVLFFHGILDVELIEFLFRLFRIGQILLTPTFFYIFYEFSKESSVEKKTIKKSYVVFAYTWALITYIINWTDFGIISLELSKYNLYHPFYGTGNVFYTIHLLISAWAVFLATREVSKKGHEPAIRSFLTRYIYFSVLLLTLGVLNFIEDFLLLAGTFGVLIFSTLIAFSILRYNFSVITRLNTLLSRSKTQMYANNLLANLIHELRNPLAAVQGYSEILPNMQDLNEDGKLIVSQISLATDHMGAVVDGFVQFVKGGQLSQEKYQVDKIVKESIALISKKREDNNVTINLTLQNRVFNTYADKSKLRQVFINIIGNSIDALKDIEGDRVINVSLRKSNQDEILVDINDNGNGMPDYVKKNLFSLTKSDKDSGFGLGLVISKNIIMAHGGSIELKESNSNGTHFQVVLPVLYKPIQ